MQSLNLQGIGMTSRRTRERLIKRLLEQGITDQKVLGVIRDTPRHIFVDEALSHRAYEDTALPIGFNQTISRPYTVARMTSLLLQSAVSLERVLEIGTGSGYQTTVLSQLVGKVYSVERIKGLQNKARQRLHLLKVRNVQFKHSDGGFGWPEQAPFDAILAAAAPTEIPQELINQLVIGGRLVIPVGDGEQQELRLIVRTEKGFEVEQVEQAKFVPFLSGAVS